MGLFTSSDPACPLVAVVVSTLIVAGFAILRLSSCSKRRPPSCHLVVIVSPSLSSSCRFLCRRRVALLAVVVSSFSPSFLSTTSSFPFSFSSSLPSYFFSFPFSSFPPLPHVVLLSPFFPVVVSPPQSPVVVSDLLLLAPFPFFVVVLPSRFAGVGFDWSYLALSRSFSSPCFAPSSSSSSIIPPPHRFPPPPPPGFPPPPLRRFTWFLSFLLFALVALVVLIVHLWRSPSPPSLSLSFAWSSSFLWFALVVLVVRSRRLCRSPLSSSPFALVVLAVRPFYSPGPPRSSTLSPQLRRTMLRRPHPSGEGRGSCRCGPFYASGGVVG
jgi:hypothetical protein